MRNLFVVLGFLLSIEVCFAEGPILPKPRVEETKCVVVTDITNVNPYSLNLTDVNGGEEYFIAVTQKNGVRVIHNERISRFLDLLGAVSLLINNKTCTDVISEFYRFGSQPLVVGKRFSALEQNTKQNHRMLVVNIFGASKAD